MNQIIENFKKLDVLHFGSEKVNVIFAPETLQLFHINSLAGSVIDEIKKGVDISELSSKYDVKIETIEGFLTKIVDAVRVASPAVRYKSTANMENPFGSVLPKLVMMVNNYCNLKCTYCYEHETVFTKKALNMSREIAETTLNKFYTAFDRIGELMFIGGEPTLSEEVIEFICSKALKLSQERGCEPPFVSMITNGLKMTDKMFELIEKYEIQVTFSIDGPKAVQDLVRIRHDNSGSYDEVSRNIKRYNQIFKDKLGIECTVTRAQTDAGYSVSDLADFFAQEFGARESHIAAAGLENGNFLNPLKPGEKYLQTQFEEAAKKSLDNIFDELYTGKSDEQKFGVPDMVSSMLRKLVKRKSSLDMCPAGTAQLVVDAFGDLYPCWMFAGMDQFKMGNLLNDDIFNEVSKKVLNRIHNNTKKSNPQCSKCYARYTCNACIGNNQNTTGSMERISEPFCNSVRGTLKTVLLKIGEVKKNKEMWNKIQGSLLTHEPEEERVRL